MVTPIKINGVTIDKVGNDYYATMELEATIEAGRERRVCTLDVPISKATADAILKFRHDLSKYAKVIEE